MRTSEKLPQFFINISSFTRNVILFFRRILKRILFYMDHLNEFQSKKYATLLAGVIFTLMLIYTLRHANTPFVHDSLYYWQFADSFFTDSFSFTNFSDGLRGYFFPFLLYPRLSTTTLNPFSCNRSERNATKGDLPEPPRVIFPTLITLTGSLLTRNIQQE